ncbi:competence protein CoiA family protein [Mesorhizobium sp. KR1-2]|uniref:competence protein CoiA n=1 Tax=Mesorhizobium sp. KR1-2 TaxID=3156609 RepID=UPI0032B422FF
MDHDQQSIHAFDLSPDDWAALVVQNRSERHLRMPCCSARVALKTSRKGTRFFAHMADGGCQTAPETEAHLRLKQMAVEAARAHGWEAGTEVPGLAPDGETWMADVLARKGRAGVAVEIQWSPQTVEETLRRQQRYRASGIRGLWLLRKTAVPAIEQLPSAIVLEGPNQTYDVALSSGQKMPVRSLLDAAFSGRLKFGVPRGTAGTVSVRVAPVNCWHDRCRSDTDIISGIDLVFGPYKREVSIAEFGGREPLLRFICDHIPAGLRIGAIKHRFSKTAGAAYLSNGCVKCDRLYGEHFEIFARYNERVACVIPIRATDAWRDLQGDRRAWGVFQRQELASSNLR